MAQGFLRKLRLTLEMIKFEHSVFALPFALTGALLAVREDGFQTAGVHIIPIDVSQYGLTDGIYFIKFKSADYSSTKKLVRTTTD